MSAPKSLPASPPGLAPFPVSPSIQLSLLEHLGEITIPGSSSTFYAKDHFLLNTLDTAQVKISCLNEGFRAWFVRQLEPAEAGIVLRYARLRESVDDALILRALGAFDAPARAATSLRAICWMLTKQRNREPGPLLVSGASNVFYALDIEKVLRPVEAHWFSGGWFLRALAFPQACNWPRGCRVFAPVL